MEIFGNPIDASTEKKAVDKRNKFARKFNCETPEPALQAPDLTPDDRDLLRICCDGIVKRKKIGAYNGAYNVVKIAMGKQ